MFRAMTGFSDTLNFKSRVALTWDLKRISTIKREYQSQIAYSLFKCRDLLSAGTTGFPGPMYRTRTLPGPLLHHARTVPVPTMVVARGLVAISARAGSQSPREASRNCSRTGCFCRHGQMPRSAGWCHVALAHGVPGSGLPDISHGHSRVGFWIKIYDVQRFQIRFNEETLILPPTGRIQCFQAKYQRSPDVNGNSDTNWLRSRPPSGSAAVRSNVRTNPWQQVSRCSQIQVSTVWRRISSRSRCARRDSRIVMAQRLSQFHTRFAGHGVELLEPAGLGFLHCRFNLPLQRIELPRAVAFHEQPQPGAHDLAQVGAGAGIGPAPGRSGASGRSSDRSASWNLAMSDHDRYCHYPARRSIRFEVGGSNRHAMPELSWQRVFPRG